MLGILALFLLIACTPKEEEGEKLLSSGIQYIGNQEKIVAELEKLEIEFENPSTINIDLKESNLIIIEPNYIDKITRDDLIHALKNGFYVFFINMEDNHILQEKYLNTITYNQRKQDKIWTEQLYLDNQQLKTIEFSIEPNWENELLKWLQYFDKYKEDSK